MLDGPWRYNRSGGGCFLRGAACRPPFVSTRARFAACIATSLPPPTLSRWPQTGAGSPRDPDFPQAQLLHLLQQSLVLSIALVAAPELGQHIVTRLVLVPRRRLLVVRLAPAGVGLEEYVEQGGDGGIGLCGAHRGPARRARVWVYGGGGRGLEGKPLLQAGAAEGVEAVEQCERLVEEVGTDRARQFLLKIPLDSASTLTLSHGLLSYQQYQLPVRRWCAGRSHQVATLLADPPSCS